MPCTPLYNPQGPSASAYVTYLRSEDALRAIQCVNNVVVDGRTLKVRPISELNMPFLRSFGVVQMEEGMFVLS